MLGGPLLGKNSVPFGTYKPLILRIEFVAPARRHRCEICDKVFECHLCAVKSDSSLHSDPNRVASGKTILVCPECIKKNPDQHIVTTRQQKQVYLYDHLTGERVGQRPIKTRYTSKVHKNKLPTKRMEANRQRAERLRRERKEKGLCVNCGLGREDTRYALCTICRSKNASSQKDFQKRWRKNRVRG